MFLMIPCTLFCRARIFLGYGKREAGARSVKALAMYAVYLPTADIRNAP